MAQRTFGHLAGIAVGTAFENRRELSSSGVHRPTQAGISGSKRDGADSIVVSGGYVDDRDYGDLIIYTDHGGNDPSSKHQIADQKLDRGNMALALSCDRGLPVRVVRGSGGEPAQAPRHGYRYDGLYSVTRYWPETGSDGYLIWRFQLCRFPGALTHIATNAVPVFRQDGDDASGPVPPAEATVQRLALNTATGSLVSALNGSTCQVCRTQIETHTGPYIEVAHIRPLEPPHNGPDIGSNILCLCPNCHVLFDRLVIYVDATGMLRSAASGEALEEFRPLRYINPEHLAYHRALCLPTENTASTSETVKGHEATSPNPEWVEEEAVLLLDLYLRLSVDLGGKNPTSDTREIVELSSLLRRLKLHDPPHSNTFRNPVGVSLRYKNYQALDPTNNKSGIGPALVYKKTWDRYVNHRDALKARVVQILGTTTSPESLQSPPPLNS